MADQAFPWRKTFILGFGFFGISIIWPLFNSLIPPMLAIALGLAVLLTVTVTFLIAGSSGDAKIPEGLVAIGSAAVGALAGLLVPSPKSQ